MMVKHVEPCVGDGISVRISPPGHGAIRRQDIWSNLESQTSNLTTGQTANRTVDRSVASSLLKSHFSLLTLVVPLECACTPSCAGCPTFAQFSCTICSQLFRSVSMIVQPVPGTDACPGTCAGTMLSLSVAPAVQTRLVQLLVRGVQHLEESQTDGG